MYTFNNLINIKSQTKKNVCISIDLIFKWKIKANTKEWRPKNIVQIWCYWHVNVWNLLDWGNWFLNVDGSTTMTNFMTKCYGFILFWLNPRHTFFIDKPFWDYNHDHIKNMLLKRKNQHISRGQNAIAFNSIESICSRQNCVQFEINELWEFATEICINFT